VADRVTSSMRSLNMAAVGSKNTKPELIVRRIAYRLGYRYRLHEKDLPGKPDLVFRKRRKVIFVHGCFWHRHPDCSKASTPMTRTDFWRRKFDLNVERDRRTQTALEGQGWRILTVWECELKDPGALAKRLQSFLGE
jgi:DNA mismatch endonuclease, patch repair protein